MSSLLSTVLFLSATAWTQNKFEPPDGRIIHGFGQGWETTPGEGQYEHLWNYINAMNDNGTPPFFIKCYWAAMHNVKYHQAVEVIDDVLTSANPGGFFMVGASIDTAGPDLPSGRYDDKLDIWVRIFHRYYHLPIFFRIGFEFNGAWHSLPPAQYKAAWRYIIDYFDAAGVQNVAYEWDYYPTNNWGGTADWLDYYPGDDYVDWWGMDVFDPCDLNNNYEACLHAYMASAAAHGKPVGQGECAPRKNGIDRWGDATWGKWYSGWFDWMETDGVKQFNYINWEWSISHWSDWGDSDITHNAVVETNWRNELKESRYIHANTPDRWALIGWDASNPGPPVSHFMALQNHGVKPMNVEFFDLSWGNPTAWEWDFDGDGETDSADQNPTWLYTPSGDYDVTLKVSRGVENDTKTRTQYISVQPSGPIDARGHTIINGDAEDAVAWRDFIFDPGTATSFSAPTGRAFCTSALATDPTDSSNQAVRMPSARNGSFHHSAASAAIMGVNPAGEPIENLNDLAFRVYLPPGTREEMWIATFWIDQEIRTDDDGMFHYPSDMAMFNIQESLADGWNAIVVDLSESSAQGDSFLTNDGTVLAGFLFISKTSPMTIYVDDFVFVGGTSDAKADAAWRLLK